MLSFPLNNRIRNGRLFAPVLIGLTLLFLPLFLLARANDAVPPAAERYETVAILRFQARPASIAPAVPVPREPGPGPESAPPPVSPPGESNDAPAPPVDGVARRTYLGRVIRKVSRNKRYPRLEEKRGNEGEVLVGFEIQSDGTVQNLRVLRSSPTASFNQEALASVRRSLPLPPIPPHLGPRIPLRLKLKFKLSR